MSALSPSDQTLSRIQPADCFIDRGPEGVQVDEDKLTTLIVNLRSQMALGNFKKVATDLNNIKSHLETLKGRIKQLAPPDFLPLIINNLLGSLHEKYPGQNGLSKRVSLLKNFMAEVREQRRTDPRLRYFPSMPHDLYSKIWNLIPLEEKRRIFPQHVIPLVAEGFAKKNMTTTLEDNSPSSQNCSSINESQQGPFFGSLPNSPSAFYPLKHAGLEQNDRTYANVARRLVYG